MPKKQKRFKSEKAILKAIDAMEKRQKDKYAESDQLESDAKVMAIAGRTLEEIAWTRTLAARARRSAQRAASKKVELGKALSAMRTMLLSFPDNEDTSVTL